MAVYYLYFFQYCLIIRQETRATKEEEEIKGMQIGKEVE